MSIILHHLIPVYLASEKTQNSMVWGKDLVFEKGKKYQITAPSGSGKTSLVHFLYGLRKDFSGTIKINETHIAQASDDSLSAIRSNVLSCVFQDLKLFPYHMVSQNLEIKKALSSFSGALSIAEMTRRLGIYSKMEQPVIHCSYGEQQRVAIIRALLQPFDYLILDEPFSHLDNRNRERAFALIMEEANKRSAAIIMIDLHASPYFEPDENIML